MSERATAFLEANRSAAMITLRADGTPHAVRVGAALVDGKVWSSGTQRRLRTRHVRRDPRATLFIFDAARGGLSLESRVRILEGPDAPALNRRLFEIMQAGMTPAPPPGHLAWFGTVKTFAEFEQVMADEGRLIYEFEVVREYGLL